MRVLILIIQPSLHNRGNLFWRVVRSLRIVGFINFIRVIYCFIRVQRSIFYLCRSRRKGRKIRGFLIVVLDGRC